MVITEYMCQKAICDAVAWLTEIGRRPAAHVVPNAASMLLVERTSGQVSLDEAFELLLPVIVQMVADEDLEASADPTETWAVLHPPHPDDEADSPDVRELYSWADQDGDGTDAEQADEPIDDATPEPRQN